MTYLYLALAIIFEAGWALGIKASMGPFRLWVAVGTAAMYVLSLVFLWLTARRMEIGVAYAVWAGLGMAIIAAGGVVFFGEKMNPLKLASLGLVIAGAIGLNLAGPGGHGPGAEGRGGAPESGGPADPHAVE